MASPFASAKSQSYPSIPRTSLSTIFSPTSLLRYGNTGLDRDFLVQSSRQLIVKILDLCHQSQITPSGEPLILGSDVTSACSTSVNPQTDLLNNANVHEPQSTPKRMEPSLTWSNEYNYLDRIVAIICNLAIATGRPKPIILDVIQAIRIDNKGMPIKWLDFIPKIQTEPSCFFQAAVEDRDIDEYSDLVKDGLPPLPLPHTYKTTPVLISRQLNQSRIILKTASEKLKLEKNLRRLLQMSHSGHTRVLSTGNSDSNLNVSGNDCFSTI